MRIPLILLVSVAVAITAVCAPAWGKDSPRKFSDFKFIETPQEALNPPEIGGSMFQAAAANTVVLGWWQFDGPGGVPDPQGWTAYDASTQLHTYFHVDGSAGAACSGIAPIDGSKSMWCGQAPSSEYPWCGWFALPGYGANWDQSLESTVNAETVTYSIAWDSETGYDITRVEWWNPGNQQWAADANANGGAGAFSGLGGPLTETLNSPYGATRVRFHFTSDGAVDDEDGNGDTLEGAVKLDNLRLDAGAIEDWEDEACTALQSNDGVWTASLPPGFGNFAALRHGTSIAQEDPCVYVRSWLWGFFDDPSITNYACGGWPLQGAMRHGPDANGRYLQNEIWSPWVPITGAGDEYILSFLTYRDLPLDNLQFYYYFVQTRDTDTGTCPHEWDVWYMVQYGGQKDWIRKSFQVGGSFPGDADEAMVRLGAVDMCESWCGIYGLGFCHSHAPLFDQVRLVRVESYGPQWTVRDIDMWQDNFPEDGTITGHARCDMAQDVIPINKANILPGDSLKITVYDPNGLAADNTGGRPGFAAYAFVKATDRFGNARPYSGAQMQSPDNKAWTADPNAGLLRWPLVALGVTPPGWHAYRLDRAVTSAGSGVMNAYCGDLMDLAAGPDGPPYHPNENWAANTGIFVPGDVIWYFFGARNTLGQWAFFGRTMNGQGPWLRTNNITDFAGLDANGLPKAACEWSVLPDAGRAPDNLGDILFVDDADDRGGPAQLYFDWAFRYYGLTNLVDRYDVLGPSSVAGNSLASRVKNVWTQMIGDPVEIYQKVLWNCSDLNRGLMGDGGTPNGGTSAEKSNDFGLCYTFLDTHPDNPGWAYWGDDAVEDWATLTGAGAVNVKSTFMNHTLVTGNQTTLTGMTSPRVFGVMFMENFYAYGGCAAINDFDSPGQSGGSFIAHRYDNAATGPVAALGQVTPSAAATNARFYLAGFAYNFIRDDDTANPPDYAPHLKEILGFFQNPIGQPIGIDPLAMGNRLGHNHPNPFNPTTTIAYSIAERGRVALKIYNAAGQLVRTLVDEEKAPLEGGFTIPWDGTNDHGAHVASGVYFYRLTAKNFSQTKKMVLLK